MRDFIISPKFDHQFLLIFEQRFLPDLKSDQKEFGFIGLFV